jgi:hypothetical protein
VIISKPNKEKPRALRSWGFLFLARGQNADHRTTGRDHSIDPYVLYLVNDEMYSCLHEKHAMIDARQLINDLYRKKQ